jgi:hypothetical protein
MNVGSIYGAGQISYTTGIALVVLTTPATKIRNAVAIGKKLFQPMSIS